MASATSTTASCGSSSHLHSRAAWSALSIRLCTSSSRELCSIEGLFLLESCFSQRSIEFFFACGARSTSYRRLFTCRSVSVKRTSLDRLIGKHSTDQMLEDDFTLVLSLTRSSPELRTDWSSASWSLSSTGLIAGQSYPIQSALLVIDFSLICRVSSLLEELMEPAVGCSHLQGSIAWSDTQRYLSFFRMTYVPDEVCTSFNTLFKLSVVSWNCTTW